MEGKDAIACDAGQVAEKATSLEQAAEKKDVTMPKTDIARKRKTDGATWGVNSVNRFWLSRSVADNLGSSVSEEITLFVGSLQWDDVEVLSMQTKICS